MDVCCGAFHTFALTARGHTFGFGLNAYGQLGLPGEWAEENGLALPLLALRCAALLGENSIGFCLWSKAHAAPASVGSTC